MHNILTPWAPVGAKNDNIIFHKPESDFSRKQQISLGFFLPVYRYRRGRAVLLYTQDGQLHHHSTFSHNMLPYLHNTTENFISKLNMECTCGNVATMPTRWQYMDTHFLLTSLFRQTLLILQVIMLYRVFLVQIKKLPDLSRQHFHLRYNMCNEPL